MMGPVEAVFVLGFAAICITHIVIGALYLDQCRIEPYIPIYLLVLGCFLLLLVVLLSICSCPCDNWFVAKVVLFLVCWFFAGHNWIYPNYESVSYTSTSRHYCNKTVYLWAFGNTVACDIIVFPLILYISFKCGIVPCLSGWCHSQEYEPSVPPDPSQTAGGENNGELLPEQTEISVPDAPVDAPQSSTSGKFGEGQTLQ